MPEKTDKITKQEVLKKIEIILKDDINLAAQEVFARIEKFLEPQSKAAEFKRGRIGYVHIDEKLQSEYLKWEKSIKQEWLETIENIRVSLKKG